MYSMYMLLLLPLFFVWYAGMYVVLRGSLSMLFFVACSNQIVLLHVIT